ncbi:MAG: 2-succinyl-6-hydroxy-2,4-cyclohexadiene-1-carboxylate synthase [Prochlorotrichaceae cyanobacterium]
MALDVRITEPNGQYHFQVWTQGDPHQPWLVFLHGFLGDRFEFREVIANLCADFFCVALDLPGHGQTIVSPTLPPAQTYSMASTAAGVMGCLAKLQAMLFPAAAEPSESNLISPRLHKIRLVGYSMGGRLGLYLLLKFPQAFAGGLIESASPGLATPTERSLRLQQDQNRARKLERLTPEEFQQFLQQWYRNPLFQGLPEHPHYPALLQQRQRGNPQHLAQSLRYLGLGAQPSLWLDLSQTTIPLTFVVGAWDHKFVHLNQTMNDRCPTARLNVISGVSHNAHLGDPAQFIYITRSIFLAEHGGDLNSNDRQEL